MRVSEIRVNRIRVNQGLGVCTFNVMVGSLEFLSTVYNSSISFFLDMNV